MKYIDADKLTKKFEKMIDDIPASVDSGAGYVIDEVYKIIDSLQQEQPEVDLQKEIKEWTDLMVGASFPEQDGDFISEEDYRSVIRQTAIHFLDINARKEDK